MSRFLLGLLVVLAGSPVAAQALAAEATAADLEVTVERAPYGTWTAEYRFTRAAPAWAFTRSGLTDADHTPWRPQAWTVETPGVRLERRGRYDVLVGDGAPLTSVRIRFTPYGEELDRDYAPSLTFSDGSVAHFTDQFQVAALGTSATHSPDELNASDGLYAASGRLTFRDPGRRILLAGAVHEGEAVTTTEAGAYAYFGDAALTQTDDLAAVVDPQLPAWIHTELRDYAPRLLELYADRLGPAAIGRPTVFAAWGGAKFRGLRLDGGVRNGAMVLDIRGDQAGDPGGGRLDRLRWFYGHEIVHFWLGDTVRYARRSQAWMLEGGADLLAVRALQRLSPTYDARATEQDGVDECLKLVQPGEPLAGAPARGEPRAFYACGATLLLAAEAGLRRREPDADAFTFWRRVIEANRDDGVIGAEDWLEAFQAATGDPALTADVRRFVNTGVDDPAKFVARLFAATGVAHTAAGGVVRLD